MKRISIGGKGLNKFLFWNEYGRRYGGEVDFPHGRKRVIEWRQIGRSKGVEKERHEGGKEKSASLIIRLFYWICF